MVKRLWWALAGLFVAALVTMGALGDYAAAFVALLSLAGGGLALWAMYRGRPADGRFILGLFAAAFLLRAVAAGALHYYLVATGKGGAAFQDDWAFHTMAWLQAQVWQGKLEGLPEPYASYAAGYMQASSTYWRLMAAVYFLLGPSLLSAKIINSLLGSLIIVPIFEMARHLFGGRAARVAAVLTAFFPSLLLWSLLTLRDAPALFLVSLVIWGAMRFQRAMQPSDAVLAWLPLALLGHTKPLSFVLLSWLSPAAVFIGARETMTRRLLGGLAFAVAAAALTYWAGYGVMGWGYLSGVRPGDLERARELRAAGAASAYFCPPDSEETRASQLVFLRRELRCLPIGLAHVIAAPFPWASTTWAQRLAIPEMLAWYVLMGLALYGFFSFSGAKGRSLFLVVAYLGMVVLAMALTEGNVGTVFRHRAMIVPFVMMFSAAGMVRLGDKMGKAA